MASGSPFRRPTFITPLSGDDIFNPGQVFPRQELLRRVLTMFWRDCCHPPAFSRAPAPVVELSGEPVEAGTPAPRVRAWWLLNDGVVEEAEGPEAERLKLFFGGIGRSGVLWPRYEFRIVGDPLHIEMSFHSEPLTGRGHRTRLEVQEDGRVRVSGHEPWWGK
jgi:hypothetical protein